MKVLTTAAADCCRDLLHECAMSKQHVRANGIVGEMPYRFGCRCRCSAITATACRNRLNLVKHFCCLLQVICQSTDTESTLLLERNWFGFADKLKISRGAEGKGKIRRLRQQMTNGFTTSLDRLEPRRTQAQALAKAIYATGLQADRLFLWSPSESRAL